MTTKFKFVATDRSGVPLKRQQTSKACERCRRRKKRCFHISQLADAALHAQSSISNTSTSVCEMTDSSIQPSELSPECPLAQDLESLPHDHSELKVQENLVGGARLQHLTGEALGRNLRFIGDTTPEGALMTATSPDKIRHSPGDRCGVWLASTSAVGNKHHAMPRNSSSLFYGAGSLVQKVLVPLLEQQCLAMLPPTSRTAALLTIYFEKIHPIFPVIDESTYATLDLRDPSRIVLTQAMCLAASKDISSRPHLLLPDAIEPMTCREFGDTLSSSARLAIEMGLIADKIIVIQALAILSQFTDNPVGEDLCSQLCERAIGCTFTLALHLKRLPQNQEDSFQGTLVCCIWALDRLNAVLHGKPVIMHDRDMLQDYQEAFSQQKTPFRVFLAIISLLDRVIDLFRPVLSTTDSEKFEWAFPAFEDLVLQCEGQIAASTLATLEMLYHGVAILSCRSKNWSNPSRSSSSYPRQTLSTSILGSTTSRDLHDHIALFPFVPYALSLSLSMAYKEMRYTKLPSQRVRSRVQFQNICDRLSELRGTFLSASTMSEMGTKLLREMDRVYTQVIASESHHAPQHVTSLEDSIRSRIPVQGEDATMPNLDLDPTLDFDPSIFDSITDVDLFDMFDPAFDLDGFDACLEGTLNPGFRMSL